MATSRRPLRVGDLVRGYLTQALLRDFSDPRLTQLIITDVELTDDLALATVRVRLLVESGKPRERQNVLRQLSAASGRLKRGLGPALGLRKVPDLRFFYDEGIDKAQRVNQILNEIARESPTETLDGDRTSDSDDRDDGS